MAVIVGALLVIPPADARTFVVTTSVDTHDLVPGDGICGDNLGRCSLRAAMEEANTSGADTVLVGDTVSPIFLTLGPLDVTGTQMTIAGATSPTVIDGRYNLPGTDNIVVRGEGCRIFNCVITNSRRNGLLVMARNVTIGQANCSTIVAGNGAGD